MNQKRRLINHFIQHGHIDPLTSWRELGIYRLSDTIYRLRKDGWNILTEIKPVFNQFGEEIQIANYIWSDWK